MQIDIKNIFESITPENIKSNPVIGPAMDIFIDVLNEKCSESIDIRNAFQNTKIRKELIKVYLDDLYRALYTLQYNEDVKNTIDYVNLTPYGEIYKKDFITDIAKIITDEHFYTFNLYKENKGTTKAIQYFFNLVHELISNNKKQPVFKLTSNDVFNITVEGSMPTAIYENIIVPLAHPLGFVYDYRYITQLILNEYFGTFTYTITELGVACLRDNLPPYDVNFLYIDGNTNNTNPNNLRTIKEIFFNEFENKLYYYFEPSGLTYLVQDNETRNVNYIDVNTPSNNIDFAALAYAGIMDPVYHCSIYSDFVSFLNSYADDSSDTFYASINNFNEYTARGYFKPYIYINEGTNFAYIGKFYVGDPITGPYIIIGNSSDTNALINHFHIGTGTYIQSDYQYILENLPTTTEDVALLNALEIYPTIDNITFDAQNAGNEVYFAKEYKTFEVYRVDTQLLDYNQSSYPDGYVP